MAFRARTVENVSQGKLAAGEIMEIDGVTFGPRMRIYDGVVDEKQPRMVDGKDRPFGAPTAAQLASDRLLIETLTGLPWPGSSADRHGKGKCANGMANALAGAISPFGEWPDRTEKIAQGNHRYAREAPQERAEKLLAQRPFRPEERATVRSKAAAVAAGMDTGRFATEGIDVESLPSPERRGGKQQQPSEKRRAG